MIFKKIGNMENVEVICHYFRIVRSNEKPLGQTCQSETTRRTKPTVGAINCHPPGKDFPQHPRGLWTHLEASPLNAIANAARPDLVDLIISNCALTYLNAKFDSAINNLNLLPGYRLTSTFGNRLFERDRFLCVLSCPKPSMKNEKDPDLSGQTLEP